MRDYINFEALSHFFDKLFEKFSELKHTHTKSDISDLQDLSAIATDDGNGNVTLICSSDMKTYSDRVSVLEEEVVTLKATLNDNDILVANNASK